MLFVNDVLFCAHDALRLLHLGADMAFGLDFGRVNDDASPGHGVRRRRSAARRRRRHARARALLGGGDGGGAGKDPSMERVRAVGGARVAGGGSWGGTGGAGGGRGETEEAATSRSWRLPNIPKPSHSWWRALLGGTTCNAT